MGSAVYHDGYLHTNSAYFMEADIVATNKGDSNLLANLQKVENIADDYERAKEYAKSKEISFYQIFFPGVTEYSVFIGLIRNIFEQADKAGEKIRRLGNAYLKPQIQTSKGKEDQVNFRIKINSKELAQTGLKIPPINTEEIKYSGDIFYLSINDETEIKAIKIIANHIKEQYNDSTNINKFNPESSNPEAIARWLDREIPQMEGEIAKELMSGVTLIKDNPKNGGDKTQTIHKRFMIGQFPFKWTKKQIAEYRKSGNQEFEAEFAKAKQEVRKFLIDQLQIGSDDDLLRAAFNESWRIINAKKADDYFFEGDNLIKAVLGNVGEFQLDLMIKYAAMATRKYNGKLGQIVGDIVQQGRGQGRTDYQIMVSLGADIGSSVGIQVKNIDEKRYKEIEVNSDLGLIEANLGSNVTTSVANYQFNADIANEIGDMEEILETYVNNYIWRVLNFDVNENLMPEHTNTFYWLGGSQIIPVSEIINRLYQSNETNKQLMNKPNTTVSGLTRGKTTDNEYNQPNKHALFTTYWQGSKPDWTPTPANSVLYKAQLAKVKIKSILDLASFLEVTGSGNFEIFIH